MYLTISSVFLILFGVVHANTDSGLDLLQRHSQAVDAFASRHAVIIVEPPSRIARNSYPFGNHLEGRSDGCPSGYDPCGGDSCCPPGCTPCNDNTNTCCDIGTFCTYNGTKPVCGCFGPSCPGENTPPPTSSTHHPTTTSTSTFYGVTFSSVFDPFTSTSTSMSTSTGLTTGSVGFSSTTTSLSIATSSVAPLPSATTSASGSSSGNAGSKTSAAAAVDFKPPLLIVLGVGIVTLLIEHGIRIPWMDCV